MYLRVNEDSIRADELQEWMRIVYNLVHNGAIDGPDEYMRSLGGLRKLLPYSRNILQHLKGLVLEPLGFSREQLEEESLKAKLLFAHGGWVSRIHSAEAHGYFQGQIDFLLSFCRVSKHAVEEPVAEWPPARHEELQLVFDVYLAKAQITFDSSGLTSKMPDYQWQRALLAVGDYLMSGNRNRSVLTNPARNWDSWKRFLRGSRREYLRQLWDRIEIARDIQLQLAAVIGDKDGLEPWRVAVVSHPEVIGYCGQREIRQDSWSKEIYLLRKKQMNRAHAELFSFALHCELSAKPDWLEPLEVGSYQSVTMADDQPHFALSFSCGEHVFIFIVRSFGGRFEIYTQANNIQKLECLKESLQEDCGFIEEPGVLICRVAQGGDPRPVASYS